MWKPRSIAQYLFVVMLVAGCAAKDEDHVYIADEEIADEECTRLDAAVELSTVLFKAIPDIQKQAIEDCGRGDAAACISVPFAVPYTALIAAGFAPMGFLIGLMADAQTQTTLCGHARGARLARPQKPAEYTKASVLAQAEQGDPEAQ